MHDECNCGHDHCHDHEHDDMQTVVISMDGVDIECNPLGVFTCGEREYIALLPVEDDETLIFRFTEKDGEIELDNIESDEEYNAVSEAFYAQIINDDDDDWDDDDDNDDWEDDDEDDEEDDDN